MSVYVHNSDLDFNAIMYCFMRAYHLPTLEGQELPIQDTWFIVPAVQYGPVVNLVNSNIAASALTIIDAEGHVIQGSRINPNVAPALSAHEIGRIKKEAFDIPLWEMTNQKSFPYDSMFNKVDMMARLNESGLTKQDILTQTTSNILYNDIRTKVRGRPCTTCGKGKKR